MKTLLNKRMIKQKEREVEKHKVKPCNDLMDLHGENKKKVGTPGKREDETIEIRTLMSLRNRKLSTWMKQE